MLQKCKMTRLLALLLWFSLPTFSHAQPEIDLVVVDKSKRAMYLFSGFDMIKEYKVALGKQPKGHKQREGDFRTPEGWYMLDFVIEESSFHRSMHINYPNEVDRFKAQSRGEKPGGNIKIHGQKNGEKRSPSFTQSFDWTDGCIALTNEEMDEFLNLVPSGTSIYIEW